MVMKVFRECGNCQDRITLIPGVLFNLSCQKCGSNKGSLIWEDGNQKSILLSCECGKNISVSPGTTVEFTHEIEKKRHKLFKIIQTSNSPTISIQSSPKVKPISDVTAIVTCHDNLDLTKDCINHLRLSDTICKVILIDNNSTDETEKWSREQKDIKYVRNKINWGCAIARNQGAKWATTKWLLFLDNDQFVSPHSVRELLEVGTDIVGTELWRVKNSVGHTERRKDRNIDKFSYVGAGGMLVKRSTFEFLGGFDERFAPMWYEDVDFIFRAREANITIGVVNEPSIQHLGGRTSGQQETYNSEIEKRSSRKTFVDVWGKYINGLKEESPLDPMKVNISKPRVVIVIDFPGWAWDNKAQQLKKYLSNDFDIDLIYFGLGQRPDKSKDYDLYFTFECNFVNNIKGYPLNRIISGVTAHTYVNMPNFEFSLSRCLGIHANSMILFNEIKRYNQNCFYVPNGVDEEQFRFVERNINKPFVAGYVGKPNPRKGLEEFIRPACEKAGVILKDQTSKINFKNKIDHKDMPKYYESIDVIMVASDMDGTPNQLLEAASVGRTFIGNPIGNVPEFVADGRNGFMVPNRDIDFYVERLEYLKNNREICKKMGENARDTVEKEWSWKIQAENYRQMFKSLLGK